ncbi:transporter [Pedobacter sp. MC2016-15]|uniref:MFS transporter n=1 Tax=Pedobacter sp. MC2016-15 TaxID=2994473 RepID=UPI0022466614|nr:MFS transporter [Pedobacter sp. MC2016-15]MCX2478119.1 transporter [Pedobacter sp. MC2016-15]
MNPVLPVFKSWVPVWLIRITMFIVIIPGLLLFGLSTASAAGAAGYYGIEPADVQYSMIAFYAAVAGFFALERRFFVFTATREYFLISTLLQVVTSYICFHTHSLPVLFAFRFMQGMANCMSTSICITLIFGSLRSERAREIGYSVFYGLLLCITPVSTIVTAPIIDAFDFNVLYKFIIFAYVPGTLMLLLIMNNIRLSKKMPLYQLDFYSFFLYSCLLCSLGYILLYGEQYYWFQDQRIVYYAMACIALLALIIFRQLHLKRPYLNLAVFKSRNFNIGILMILTLYIVRGALGITSQYFATVLGMDPIHIGYLMIANIGGIFLGVLVSSRLIILKRPMRLIWLYGFFLLLIFHVWMWFLFSTQADAGTFIIPLIVQGVGAGMLMAPIIIFMISSVPAALAGSASAMGVFFRFLGFCSSIAIINYFQLQHKAIHVNRFQDQLSGVEGIAGDRLTAYAKALSAKGVAPDQSVRIARGMLGRAVDAQASLRTMMDYYLFISIVLFVILLVIALFPYLNKTRINLLASQPSPVGY